MKKNKNTLSSRKKAKIGDIIVFNRKHNMYEGKVFVVRDNSVLVEISKESASMLGYEMANTIVRHGNYSIKSEFYG